VCTHTPDSWNGSVTVSQLQKRVPDQLRDLVLGQLAEWVLGREVGDNTCLYPHHLDLLLYNKPNFTGFSIRSLRTFSNSVTYLS
jgi:hypothetical protein